MNWDLDVSELRELANWYRGQCDGDWEHQWGVIIETLDNPGWSVRIHTSSTSTPLTDREKQFSEMESEDEWFVFWVENGTYHAACAPMKIETAIAEFLNLVAR